MDKGRCPGVCADWKSRVGEMRFVEIELGGKEALSQVNFPLCVPWNREGEGTVRIGDHSAQRKTPGVLFPECGVQQGRENLADDFFKHLYMLG
ncbi:hypothetical protein D3C84_655570 [compost metagenome]